MRLYGINEITARNSDCSICFGINSDCGLVCHFFVTFLPYKFCCLGSILDAVATRDRDVKRKCEDLKCEALFTDSLLS